jgi:hypothetical protein
MDILKRVTGTWMGTYSYDPSEPVAKLGAVTFTLTLKQQGWFGRFVGTVSEDAALGIPGVGGIEGYFSYPRIEFTKRMPRCFVTTEDGRLIPLRDYVAEEGYAWEHDMPHPAVFHQGQFSGPDCAAGTWTARPVRFPVGGGQMIVRAPVTGTWSMDKAPPNR